MISIAGHYYQLYFRGVTDTMSKVTAVVGAQWGDEGKGKIVDSLAESFQCVSRFQGGANAGHTINNQFGRFALHLLPSGVFHPQILNMLGAGVAVRLESLFTELEQLAESGVPTPTLGICRRAQLVLDSHILQDKYAEEHSTGRVYGSTKSGIAPFYSAKYAKKGVRVGSLFDESVLRAEVEEALALSNYLFKNLYQMPEVDADQVVETLLSYRERVEPFLVDSLEVVNKSLKKGDSLLLEGQLGALRDPDYGIYPYTTSSSTLAGFATVGAGVPPHAMTRIIAVVKAYSSKVGAGPFVVDMGDTEEAHRLRSLGGDKGEYGATTKRPRDVGWLDLVATRYGCKAQGATEIALTNLDVLGHFKEIPVCTAYKTDSGTTSEFLLNHELEKAKPEFKIMKGWDISKEDFSKITSYDKFPDNARRYVEMIEEFCETPIKIISIGPRREEMVVR